MNALGRPRPVRIRRRILMAVTCICILVPSSARTGLRDVDLRSAADTRISHAPRVGSAGDVNGDGKSDVIVGECGFNERAGWSKVLFGPFGKGNFDAHEMPGFAIEGWSPNQNACSVGGAGDVNGDGLDDVLVGAYNADNNAREDSGTVYVVFGKNDSTTVHLSTFDAGSQGSQGFRIDGSRTFSLTGYLEQFGPAGDVNRDGYADLIIGAVFAGSAYVVFGQPVPANVDLLTFETDTQGPRGFRIDFPTPDRSLGLSVAGAGDVNADGLDDLILGVIPKILADRGQAHVVFGKSDPMPIDVRNLGNAGFSMRGLHDSDMAGYAVSSGGNVNGDSYDDVIIGVPKRYVGCCEGLAIVVFGKADSDLVRLRKLDGGGYRIRGIVNDAAGTDVANGGDINGDGLSDQLVGAPHATYKRRPSAGAVYVVFGSEGSQRVRVDRLGERGFRLLGARRDNDTGWYVAGPQDLDDDSTYDLLFSAHYRGLTYIVSGNY